MGTGENEQALRKIIDLTRICSIAILVMNIYVFCYPALQHWGYTHPWIDKVLVVVERTALFQTIWHSKLLSLALLLVSLIGAQGKKSDTINPVKATACLLAGILFFLLSHAVFLLALTVTWKVIAYMVITVIGFLLILTGGTWLSRLIRLKMSDDIFNRINESFPQEEQRRDNEYSINLPAQYVLKGKLRKSWINIINPFRGVLVSGLPGSGKSYFVIRHIITQHIAKGFTMFVYDFKFDDLSRIAYNALLRYQHRYSKKPSFYVIDFDDIYYRCNPLDPASMDDITDATESSRSIMLGLNRDWIKKQGDFFIESSLNFLSAVIWFLRKYEDGKYCTLPHVIELMQVEYSIMFPLLKTEPEIEVLVNPFESAYHHEAWDQLEGQIASAKIGMARLSSPVLYYVLSGNDFTLDINNPDEPKVICMGNNPQKQQIYGAVVSLYVSRLTKLVNKANKLKSSLVFDEYPTLYFQGMDNLIATARGNKVATTIAVQDYSQLRRDYGREQADVVMNICGNVVSGQVVGDTAKTFSERFGKIVQERQSVSINRNDTSVSRSTQLDSAIPPSKIATLSSGEFVGIVADDPQDKIQQKIFHAEIINDHDALRREEQSYRPIPRVRNVTLEQITQNYHKIKEDIRFIIEDRLASNV
jgi:hypothetical protein